MLFLVALASLLLAVAISRWLLRRGKENPLDWEGGRRKAREPFRRPQAYYDEHGVVATEEYTLNSRGVEIFTKRWMPRDGRPCGAVFFCHGYAATCIYSFENVATRLAASGFAVVSMDYEGHGLSAGLHAYIPSFSQLVADVVEVATAFRARPELRGLPWFLYGESMGGAVAIQAYRFHQKTCPWAGMVLMAPMCKIAEEVMPPKPLVWLGKWLSHIIPTMQLVPQRNLLEIGCRDPAKRAVLGANPVAYGGRPRVRTAVQLLQTTQDVGAHLHEVDLPLLVLHGEADIITDPRLSEELVARSTSTDKTLNIYPNAWHGLIAGEPDDVANKVLADIIGWLKNRSMHAPDGESM